MERPGRRHQGDRARAGGRRDRRRHPGRFDDRRAVRQERAFPGGQPHDLREAARGGHRVPADPPVAAAQDPPRVPELDLFRKRRLRGRVGRARLLRSPARLRGRRPLAVRNPQYPAVCGLLTAVSGGAARGHGGQPERFRSRRPPEGGGGAAAAGAPGHARAGLHHPGAVRERNRSAAADGSRHPATRGAAGGAVLHQLAAPADPPRDGLRASRGEQAGRRVSGLLRRPEDPDVVGSRDAAGRRPDDRTGSALRERDADGGVGVDR